MSSTKCMSAQQTRTPLKQLSSSTQKPVHDCQHHLSDDRNHSDAVLQNSRKQASRVPQLQTCQLCHCHVFITCKFSWHMKRTFMRGVSRWVPSTYGLCKAYKGRLGCVYIYIYLYILLLCSRFANPTHGIHAPSQPRVCFKNVNSHRMGVFGVAILATVTSCPS